MDLLTSRPCRVMRLLINTAEKERKSTTHLSPAARRRCDGNTPGWRDNRQTIAATCDNKAQQVSERRQRTQPPRSIFRCVHLELRVKRTWSLTHAIHKHLPHPRRRTSLQDTAIAPFVVEPRASFSTTFSTHTSLSSSLTRFHVLSASLSSCACSPSGGMSSATLVAPRSESPSEKRPLEAPSIETAPLSRPALGGEKPRETGASCLFEGVGTRSPKIGGSLSARVTLAREHCGR